MLRIALLYLLVSMPAGSTLAASDTVLPGIQELVTRSDVIFSGVCLSSTGRWDDVSRIIVTDAVFRVDRYIKGSGPREVRVTSPGGVLPERNHSMAVTGMAEYTPGEEVLMFVTQSARSGLEVYGMGRGKLTIQMDAARERRVRGEPLSNVINSINVIIEGQRRKP